MSRIVDFINPFMARLFGSKQDEAPVEETEQAPAAEVEQAPPPPPPKHELSFPAGHPVMELWTARCQQHGFLPQPAACLEGKSGGYEAASEHDAQKELSRLQMMINAAAGRRLKQIQPIVKAAGETNEEAAGGEEGSLSPPDLDAQASVFLSSDYLAAWLFIFPPSGEGQEIDGVMLEDALKAQNVVSGVDEKLLASLPEDEERYFQLYPIARGQPPVHGTDGRVVDLYPRVIERRVAIDEFSIADYTSLGLVHNVDENDVICKIIPPEDGVPGHTVQGQEIPARNGRPAQVPKGRNTALNEDGSELIATITGYVEFTGRHFQVKPLLDIPGNVDYSTGSINFLGDVCIHGDICSGFTVRALGSITVAGVVEACTVEAGADLIVAGGIQGDNQAIIRAQRNIYAKFIENACVYVKESLNADCLINCDVYCDGKVNVSSGRMTVIGGKIRAAQEVNAGIIGSRTECRTDIILGGQPCGSFDYDILEREIMELTQEMERTERQPESPNKLKRMGKIRMQLVVNRKKLEQISKEKDVLTEEQQQDPGVRRMVGNTVYPGTVLTIGSVVYPFTHKLHPCTATLTNGEITLI